LLASTRDITGVILSENLASENPFSWKLLFFSAENSDGWGRAFFKWGSNHSF
jgi:hypothetical protein